jgi:hypothetical protein
MHLVYKKVLRVTVRNTMVLINACAIGNPPSLPFAFEISTSENKITKEKNIMTELNIAHRIVFVIMKGL